MRFGSNDSDEINFRCHLDSCAAMNTGNMLLHMWLMTKYPHVVVSYEQSNDANAFAPLALDTAIPSKDKELLTNQLTGVVVYKTRYVLPDGKPATIAFGLGTSISVNAIIGIPTWKSWGINLDLSQNLALSATLQLCFPLSFTSASTGLPPGIQFSPSDFVRPQPALPPKPATSPMSIPPANTTSAITSSDQAPSPPSVSLLNAVFHQYSPPGDDL